jgi:hypothetical protein
MNHKIIATNHRSTQLSFSFEPQKKPFIVLGRIELTSSVLNEILRNTAEEKDHTIEITPSERWIHVSTSPGTFKFHNLDGTVLVPLKDDHPWSK